ncbi:MAG: hypothetical protein EHM34_09250 [Nitrosopumilales archaeon]|nr:MAG: hypothetical protein EHM34_09250 [Nitrosopumilales archaeon]
MNKQSGKLKVVPVETDQETLKNIVKEVVIETFDEKKEEEKRSKRIASLIGQEKAEGSFIGSSTTKNKNALMNSLQSLTGIPDDVSNSKKYAHNHNHGDHKGHNHDSCPTCTLQMKKIGNGIEICPDCQTVVTKPGAEFYTCADCGNPVPKDFLNTDKNCPVCGSGKVLKGLHKK